MKLKFGQRLTNLFSGAAKGFGEIDASNSKNQSPKIKTQITKHKSQIPNPKSQITNNKTQNTNYNSSFRLWLQASIEDNVVHGREMMCPSADGSSPDVKSGFPLRVNIQPRCEIGISASLQHRASSIAKYPVECFPQFYYNNSTFSSITYFYLQAGTAPPPLLWAGSRWPVYFWIRPGP